MCIRDSQRTEEETPRKRERLFKEGKINGTMAKSMPLSSTSAICAGKTALSRTHRPLSKRHHQLRRLALKAVQTPRKPAETVAPASNEDEKEAYPFEKQYKDCACVRFARRRSCTREPISIRFDEGDQSVSSKRPKLSKTETISFLKP